MTIFGKRIFVDTVKGVGTIFLIRFSLFNGTVYTRKE